MNDEIDASKEAATLFSPILSHHNSIYSNKKPSNKSLRRKTIERSKARKPKIGHNKLNDEYRVQMYKAFNYFSL
jgi:hypothetical protein